MERQSQEQLRAGLEVLSSDGQNIGKIIEVHEDTFIVEKGWFFPRDYTLAMSDVHAIEDDRVLLARTRHELGIRGGFLGAFGGGGELGPRKPPEQESFRDTQHAQGLGEQQSSAEETRVPLYEEEVRTSKHTEQAGEVRVTKHVVTEQRQITVPVAHEIVTVEHIPASELTEVTEAGEIFRETTVTVPIREEMVDVEKRPVLREEVRVTKTIEEEQQPVSTTVRREVAEIEGPGEVVEEEPRLRKTGTSG